MADDVEVESVDFVDGLLSITLKKELPEKQKRKVWFGESWPTSSFLV